MFFTSSCFNIIRLIGKTVSFKHFVTSNIFIFNYKYCHLTKIRSHQTSQNIRLKTLVDFWHHRNICIQNEEHQLLLVRIKLPHLLYSQCSSACSPKNDFKREMFKGCMSCFPGNRPLHPPLVRSFSISQVKIPLLLIVTEPGFWAGRLKQQSIVDRRWDARNHCGTFHFSFLPNLVTDVAEAMVPPSQLSACVEFHLFNQTETDCSVKVLVPSKISFLLSR